VPEFCRHGRFAANCRICAKPDPATSSPTRSRSSGSTSRTSSPSRRGGSRRSSDVVVRKVARAVEDGYENELVPGLRASGDAKRLADEMAFATARLAELAADPPGLYAEVALGDDVEEALWLAFLIAYISPLGEDAEDAFAGIRAARTTWASGELPDLSDVPLGPRTSHDPKRGDRTLVAYRAWAERSGSQAAAFAGEPAWTPERRFDRVFERLALPGFGRSGRFELLVPLGRLGRVDVSAGQLQLIEASDPATLGAKRVFGIGDTFNLERRAAELAEAADVPIEALDLALANFGLPQGPRATMGSTATPDDSLREQVGAALDV
jgi:hypothetical protein